MGGKNSTSTSSVDIPPAVLARYQSVNAAAQQTASTPFQQYSTSPDAFVAPINAEQTQGINATNTYANAAQPYIGAATGYTLAGANPVNAAPITGQSINQYLSPYLGDVLGSTSALLNQNNQQQQSGALGEAVQSGAFGGDRAGIAAANLEQQQNLANANIYSGIANTGFNTALATAQQQQGVNLGAEQANRAAVQQTGASLANLGTTAQTAGLQGAQAQQAAGATQQQTTQAGDTALYNQFLQQQSYPFQVDQFLANIAEGTWALSGSTTTTTQPQSIFSDERLKEDVETIGKTFSGQNVVAFRYKGDPTRRIGLIAQDVEKKHPEAVREVGGFKAVDYDKATDADARKGHFYKGGLVPANDDWRSEHRQTRAAGGYSMLLPGEWPTDVSQLLSSQVQGPYAQGGLYGTQSGGAPRGGLSYVPSASLPVSHLAVAQPAAPPPSMLSQATQLANLGTKAYDFSQNPKVQSLAQKVWSGVSGGSGAAQDASDDDVPFRHGGLVRQHRDIGGNASGSDSPFDQDVDPYTPVGPGLNIPEKGSQNLSLAVAKPPAQQQGSGLGDIASIGSDIAKILPFIPGMARGGHVLRKGYDDGGPVDDATEALEAMNPLMAPGLEAGKALAPVVVQSGGDPLMTAGTLGYNLGRKMAQNVQQAATGQSVSVPITDQMQQLRQAQQQQSRPARSGSRSATLGAPIQAPAQNAPSIADATDALPSATMAPDVDTSPDLEPAVQVASKLRQPSSGSEASDGSTGSGSGSGGIIGSALNSLRGMHFDRDTILPILSGIAAAGAAPTVHPLVALAQGLGGYANSAMAIQQQEANIAQTRAQAGLTGAEAYRTTQPPPPTGTQPVPGPGPDGKSFIGPDGKPWHYAVQGEAIGDASTLTPNAAGAAVPKGTLHGPISADYGSGTYNIGPSSAAETNMATTYKGFDPSQSGVVNRARVFSMNPGVANTDATDEKLAQDQIGDPNVNDTMHRQLVQLSTAINSLSPQGFQGVGANFEDRANLVNIYHTYAGMLGMDTGGSDVGTLNNAAIIAKIKALTGTAMANANNERAASIANELSAVLPGGGLQPGAANELLGTLMVQNQRQRDFLPYYQNYVAQNGFSAGVNQAFARDMTPQYDREQALLPKMMARGKSGVSVAEALTQHPQGVQKIEQGYKRPDGTPVPGFGEGIGRYWR